MGFSEILFELFELLLLMDDVMGIIPLARGELAIDERAFIVNVIGGLLSAGIKEGWLESINLLVIAQLGSIDKTGKPYKVTVC
jgi:hypothetical protein